MNPINPAPGTWLAALILLMALSGSGVAQNLTPQIAVLQWHDSPNDVAALRGLRRGLAAMNMAGHVRILKAGGDRKKATRLLAGIQAGKVDLLVTLGTRATRIAMSETRDVPIVFTAVTNPVLSGITSSWSGAGGRVCGNSNWLDRRDMLKAFNLAVPGMKRLLVVRTPDNPVSGAEIKEARQALKGMPGLKLVVVDVTDANKVAQVLRPHLEEADGIWVPIDFPLYQEEPLRRLMDVAQKRKIPVFSSTPRCAGTGALVVMTVDFELLGLKASALVRDVLRHRRDPGAIPVGRLKSSRLFVDVAAARRIGLKLPLDLILAAHRLFGAEDGQ